LCLDEERPMAILHRLARKPDHQPGLADACFADKHDVLGLGDELELGKGADLALLDACLQLEREGLERPLLREARPTDSPAQRILLASLPLGAQQLSDEDG